LFKHLAEQEDVHYRRVKEVYDTVKTGNKWLRWAFVEAVPPAIKHDDDLFAYYQRIKMRKGNNAAKVATARRLLTVAYRVLGHERLYERRNRMAIRCSARPPHF
jgi:hypothetical protein